MGNILPHGESHHVIIGAHPNSPNGQLITTGTDAAPTKPDALAMRFENIPHDLTRLSQWVCWRYEYRVDQKKPWTKPPFHPKGHKADITDPANWSDFETVRAAYERGGFDGIGFALTPDENKHTGVDMDAQRVGDGWSEAVRDTAAALGTYGEISPSGRGVRFFGRGALPQGKRKNGDFEIYNSGRYLTVTGHRLDGTPNTVNECGAALLEYHARYIAKHEPEQKPPPREATGNATLDDNALLDKARKVRNGAKFALLWDGGTVNGLSENDAALCYHLAFWTRKDAAQMERLLRSSGRVREKWDEPRGQTTWILREVENAIERTSDVYDPKHPALLAPDPFQVAAQNQSNEADEPPDEERDDERERDEEEAPDEPPLKITLGYPTTDTGNAERFIAQHGHRFIYSAALGWMIWDGA